MPAARYDTLVRTLSERYANLPPRLKGIARYAAENPEQMALATVAEVAAGAGVPPSAVIRFAQALGYDGFLALQRVYRERLVARSATYRERIEALRRTGGGGDDVLPRLVDSAVGELERLREHVDPTLPGRAARLVLAAQRVHVLAQRRAFPVAAYLAYGLAQLEVPAFLMDSVGGMLKQQAALLRRSDVLIAASFRNYSPEVIEAAQTCHRNGVPVIAITDQPQSPLAREAKLRFDVGDNLALPFRSLVGPMTAAQALVLAVGYAQAGSQRNGRARSA